jgi:hypothetical protein
MLIGEVGEVRRFTVHGWGEVGERLGGSRFTVGERLGEVGRVTVHGWGGREPSKSVV